MNTYLTTYFNLDKKLENYPAIIRKWKLYRLVNKCKNISDRRHPAFDQNRAMKWLGYLGAALWACYLIFFGVLLGTLDNGAKEIFDYVNGGLIFFLAADFITRLLLVDTPAQEVKPFRLLNISSKFLINIFLIRRATTLFNTLWLFFFFPFGLFSTVKYYGLSGLFSYCVVLWIIFIVNGYWYLIWRTLLNKNFMYIIIPLLIYAILIYIGIFDDKYTRMILGAEHTQPLFWMFIWFCRWALEINPLAFIIPVVIGIVLYFVNYKIQYASIYREIAEVQESKVKSREMALLNRFGVVGEYIKLDIKSIMRNKVIRQSFISGLTCTIILTLCSALTPIYDNNLFMKSYISMYCYCALAAITLTNVMCPEGNYIDCLMSRKESVLALLKAKYYFNLVMMIIPFSIFMISVICGKSTIIESLGCLLFTAGLVLPCLLQMAVYNKTTQPLNVKLLKTGGNSKTQIIISMLALFGPMIIMYVLNLLFEDWAPWMMGGMGLVGILLEPIWLRNIYNRFMERRYSNMDGFRNTRNF